MPGCLFCGMIDRKIKASIEYENEDVLAIQDINPQAPHHILIIPKKHISMVSDLKRSEDAVLTGKVVLAASEIARKNGWPDYRLVLNNGTGAGQSVFHLHMHLLAGRKMAWPPG